MNILLIHPEFPDTFWSFKHAVRFLGKKACSPPLGLLTVAAMLPPEWDKRLVDLNVRPLRDADLRWADYALIGGMVVQRESARQAIARCREAGVKVVAGGPLFTSEYRQYPEVDHFVLNEAEVTLPLFLADLRQGKAGRVYTCGEYTDLRSTPVPLWQLLDMRHYASMSVQYSRGCPYDCEFCNVTALFGRRPRTKSPAQVLAELDSLRRAGWNGGVFFVDDNFIGNKAEVKRELLPALIDWQRRNGTTPFNTQVSINLADDEELMGMMAEAGFDTVFIGIETPDPKSLEECNKSQNRHRNLVADVKRIQRSGLQVQGGFIVGFDNDTPSIFQRQINFIQTSGIVTAMVGMLQAFAGTKLYERMQQEERLTGPLSGDNVDGTTNIIPAMNLSALRHGYKSLLWQLYSPKQYYQRIRTFLQEYRPPRVAAPLQLSHWGALVRSLFRLGIVGEERFHYWRLLLWTALHRPALLPTAVTLAICGYHYRKVCQLHVA